MTGVVAFLIFAGMGAAGSVNGQNAHSWLGSVVAGADTVWLVSHESLRSVGKDSSGRSRAFDRPLLVDGHLNPALVTEQVALSGPMLDSLAMILTAVIEFDRVEEALCFDPRQAIVWVKNGVVSYIDCCFHCFRFVASPDLTPLQGKNFGRRKWELLRQFFIHRGLRFEMVGL